MSELCGGPTQFPPVRGGYLIDSQEAGHVFSICYHCQKKYYLKISITADWQIRKLVSAKGTVEQMRIHK